MTAAAFDPNDWLARAHALGRHVEIVGPVIYFGRARPGAEAANAALFAELREAGGVSALRPGLIRRGVRLARIAGGCRRGHAVPLAASARPCPGGSPAVARGSFA